MKWMVLVSLAVIGSLLGCFETDAFAHKARPVSGTQVMPLLYKLGAAKHVIPDFGEVSEAIAQASTEDPIFPTFEEGGEVTACILVAMAHYESGFFRAAIGDGGKSFGLYQIQPPTAHVDQKLLMLPRNASFVAIDLVRRSFLHAFSHDKTWIDGLAWYAASSDEGSKSPAAVRASRLRMKLAAELYETFFSKGKDMTGLFLPRKAM